MKIDINRKYRTRDGREPQMLFRLPEGCPTRYPVRGILNGTETNWADDGRFVDSDPTPNDLDLIEVREPREFWVAVFPSGPLQAWEMKPPQEAVPGAEIIHVREVLP